MKTVFLLFNAAVAMTILDLISHTHLASFVIALPKELKYFTFSCCFWSVIFPNEDGDMTYTGNIYMLYGSKMLCANINSINMERKQSDVNGRVAMRNFTESYSLNGQEM